MFLTANNEFESLVGQFIILEVDGRKKKFRVENRDTFTGVVPASAFLSKLRYRIIGPASIQNCETCENTVEVSYFTPSSAVLSGSNIDLSVQTVGNTAINYMWYKDNVLLFNSTSALNIPFFDISSSGTYYVTVSGACNLQTSDISSFTILVPSPTPSPSPSETIAPTPSSTPTDIMTPPPSFDSPSPSPTATPTPTPSQSPSPSPSTTPSPSPSEDPPPPPPTPSPSPTPYPP